MFRPSHCHTHLHVQQSSEFWILYKGTDNCCQCGYVQHIMSWVNVEQRTCINSTLYCDWKMFVTSYFTWLSSYMWHWKLFYLRSQSFHVKHHSAVTFMSVTSMSVTSMSVTFMSVTSVPGLQHLIRPTLRTWCCRLRRVGGEVSGKKDSNILLTCVCIYKTQFIFAASKLVL